MLATFVSGMAFWASIGGPDGRGSLTDDVHDVREDGGDDEERV